MDGMASMFGADFTAVDRAEMTRRLSTVNFSGLPDVVQRFRGEILSRAYRVNRAPDSPVLRAPAEEQPVAYDRLYQGLGQQVIAHAQLDVGGQLRNCPAREIEQRLTALLNSLEGVIEARMPNCRDAFARMRAGVEPKGRGYADMEADSFYGKKQFLGSLGLLERVCSTVTDGDALSAAQATAFETELASVDDWASCNEGLQGKMST